jgi:hypothetical protein
MMKAVRAGVAALAFTGLVAQPIAANACCPPRCPVANPGAAWGVAWAFGFFLCAGMIAGKQEKWAKEHHTTVSGHDRAASLITCILPPLGLAKIDHGHA